MGFHSVWVSCEYLMDRVCLYLRCLTASDSLQATEIESQALEILNVAKNIQFITVRFVKFVFFFV